MEQLKAKLPPLSVTVSAKRELKCRSGNGKSFNADFLKLARERVRKRAMPPTPLVDGQYLNSEEDQQVQEAEVPSEQETTPLNLRFRRVARMVKNQMMWTKSLAKDAEEHLKTYVVNDTAGGEAHTLTFNVNAFRPDIQSFTGLTPNAKAILVKPSWLRSENELRYLYNFTVRLKCFDRYSVFIRKELTRVIYYEAFEKGRVVLRQGDMGFNFYFIVSGGVLIEVNHEDPQTGVKHNSIVSELGPGASFGELALLHESKRRATIVCKEDSEFLTIDKPDFDMVLRKNHEMEWGKRMEIIRSHPFFLDWSETALQMVAEGSNIVEYSPNSVIIKDFSHSLDTDSVFLLVKGTCKVALKLKMLEHHKQFSGPSKKLVLPALDNDSAFKDTQSHIVRRWIAIRCLTPGEIFGLGEGHPNMSVISNQRVECLTMSRMVLTKLDRKKSLARHKEEMASCYPTHGSVFKSYVELCEWREYKRWVLQEVLNRVKPSAATNAETGKHYSRRTGN